MFLTLVDSVCTAHLQAGCFGKPLRHIILQVTTLPHGPPSRRGERGSGAWRKPAPASSFGNRGGSYTLLVLSQALTRLLAGVLDRSLSSGQTCDRHTEGRAADIVQTNLVAELDAGRISTVLAADAQTQVGTGLTAIMCSHLDQLADADLVQMLERIALVDLVLVVSPGTWLHRHG